MTDIQKIRKALVDKADETAHLNLNPIELAYLLKFLDSLDATVTTMQRLISTPLCDLTPKYKDDFELIELRKAEGE